MGRNGDGFNCSPTGSVGIEGWFFSQDSMFHPVLKVCCVPQIATGAIIKKQVKGFVIESYGDFGHIEIIDDHGKQVVIRKAKF